MNILLLEDDISLHKAIKKVLELTNSDVHSFYDGNEVLLQIDNHFDLYILDINVPNIDGLELLNMIYNQNKNAKIIMISSNTDLHTLTKAYELGCIDYLRKPFHLQELRMKINRLQLLSNSLLDTIAFQENVTLTKKEKDFLLLLLEYKNMTITYELISQSVYKDKEMSMDALRSMIRRLRLKLADDIIINVLDEGYRLKSVNGSQ